jgi:FkbM family methyltransferase
MYPVMINPSDAFRLAYGQDPSYEDLERISQIAVRGEAKPAIEQLRNVIAGFDRQTHPTPITVRFTQDDIRTVDMESFKLVTDRRDFAVGLAIGPGAPWEPHLSEFFVRSVKPGMTAIDIGANVGFHSMLLASLVGADGHVLAFEPNTENCRLIMLSAAENGFKHIELFPIALADAPGALSFTPAVGSNGVLLPSGRDTLLHPNCTIVPAMRLDDLIGDRKIDFIKADIEGAEYRALSGATRVIARDRPIITSEFSLEMLGRVSGIKGADYLHWICSLGYRISIVKTDRSGLESVSDVEALIADWGSVTRIEDLAFIPSASPMRSL